MNRIEFGLVLSLMTLLSILAGFAISNYSAVSEHDKCIRLLLESAVVKDELNDAIMIYNKNVIKYNKENGAEDLDMLKRKNN